MAKNMNSFLAKNEKYFVDGLASSSEHKMFI